MNNMKSLTQYIQEAKQTVDLSKLDEIKNIVNAVYMNKLSGTKTDFDKWCNELKEITNGLKESEWRSQSSTKKNWIMLYENNKRWNGEWFIIGEPNKEDTKYPRVYKLELDGNKVSARIKETYITELNQQYGNNKGMNEVIACKLYYF